MSNTVSIFLASSSELQRERILIGNKMRMLNDVWEPKGVRIILHVWEDYHPEFTGERKQTEYDLDLVDGSKIVLGLFRSVCGKYSQEEVLRGHRNNPDTLYCYRLLSDNDAAVKTFEISSGIPMKPVSDISEAWDCMRTTVEEYIASSNIASAEFKELGHEKVYVTIGADLRKDENEIGDMIRSVDLLADQMIGIRCKMQTLRDRGIIAESDYYLAIFNNELDAQSQEEFVTAYKGLLRNNHPAAITTYQKKGGTVTVRGYGNKVSELMYKPGKEFFPVVFECIDTVKLKLFLYLAQKKRMLSPEGAFALGKDNGLYLGGRRIMEMGKALGLHSGWGNDFSTNVGLLEMMMPTVSRLGMEARLREKIRELLSINDLTASEATELVKNCTELIGFLIKNTGRFYEPDYVLRMMLLRIASNDRYDELIGYTPDIYYQEFVDYADRYSIEDVSVEVMRINVANGLARDGQEDEAMRLYGMARRNLQGIDMNGKVMRQKVFLLYYNALAALSTIRQEKELNLWAAELEALVEQWISEDDSLVFYRCYLWAFRIDVLPVDLLADPKLITGAETLWHQIKESSIPLQNRYDWLAADQGLTSSLSRYYVDRISVQGLSMDMIRTFSRKAQSYLDAEEKLCKELMDYNRDEAMKHYASLLHNRGFLLKKIGNPFQAIGCYLQGIQIRKQLFANYPTVSREDDVAETMVNIGALLLETSEQFISNHPEIHTDALYYAEEALAIYARHNDGTLYHATNEYKARLLKGTVLFYKGADDGQKQEGMAILQDVKQWDEENPCNYYHATIVNELRRCGTPGIFIDG